MRLLIISHTEHYLNKNGNVCGWGATVREIDHLTDVFEEIYHIAPLYKGQAQNGSIEYTSNNVKFIGIKPTGGRTILTKLDIFIHAMSTINLVLKTLRKVDIFQFRAPTGIGVYLIPLLMISKKKGWFKYAGNWVQETPPLGYAIQRFYLNHTKKIVTINGTWPNQKKNVLTFFNPCLTEAERHDGEISIKNKSFDEKLHFVFIGRLEDAKGVQRILNVFSKIESERIGVIHLIGDGPNRIQYEEFARLNCKHIIKFHGFLSRVRINEILQSAHVFLLPSDSEGFPKVIAEAVNFGLIPIVSDVSSIGQYIIDGVSGFLVQKADESILKNKIEFVLKLKDYDAKNMVEAGNILVEKFTYRYYNLNIRERILS